MRLDVLFGEDGATCGNPADERQTELLAHGVLQLDATRSTRHQGDHPFARQGPQMFLRRIGGSEPQLPGDFSPGGRHAGLGDTVLNQSQDLGLAGCQVGHVGTCLFIQIL